MHTIESNSDPKRCPAGRRRTAEAQHQAAVTPRGGGGRQDEHRARVHQCRRGAGDAEVGDGLPGRDRRDRDGGGDPGALPAGAGAGQLGGHGGADLDPGGVHLRAGVRRGCGLQPAGLADPQDPCDQRRRRRVHRLGPAGRRASAGRGGADRGEVAESVARTICGWTDKLPQECQEDADAILLGAAAGGADVADLAGLAGEIYARSLPRDKIKDKDADGDAEEGPARAARRMRRSRTGACGWRPRSGARGC